MPKYEFAPQAVIDGIGKSTVDISLGSLARRGIFVSFGNASGAVPAFPVLKLIGKSAFVTRPKLLDYTGEHLRHSRPLIWPRVSHEITRPALNTC